MPRVARDRDFAGGPVAKTWFPMPGAGIPSQVWGTEIHMLCSWIKRVMQDP